MRLQLGLDQLVGYQWRQVFQILKHKGIIKKRQLGEFSHHHHPPRRCRRRCRRHLGCIMAFKGYRGPCFTSYWLRELALLTFLSSQLILAMLCSYISFFKCQIKQNSFDKLESWSQPVTNVSEFFSDSSVIILKRYTKKHLIFQRMTWRLNLWTNMIPVINYSQVIFIC